MFVTLAVHVLVGAVAEDCRDFVAVGLRARVVQFLECIVVLAQGLDGVNREEGGVNVLALGMDVLLMVLKNVLRHLADAFFVMVEIVDVDLVALAVFGVIQHVRINAPHGNPVGEDRPLVLHREAEDVPVGNGVLDHIPVQAGIPLGSVRHQAGIEDIRRGSAVGALVGFEDRGTGEADVICVPEVPVDVSVHLAELAAVAFVDDEDDLLVPVGIHQGFIALGVHSVRHFLDGCDDQLAVRILQLLHQHIGAVGVINAILFKGVVFVHRLVIQVLPVDEEDDLVHSRLVPEELCQFEGGQRFAAAGAGEYIAVLVGLQHPLSRCLHRVNLIGPHGHQHRLCRFDDHELGEHFRQCGFPEEFRGEVFQGVDALVFIVRPEEDQALQDRVVHAVFHLVLVAEVLGLHGVGDNKQLQIPE